MRISKATPNACRYACTHFHYSHRTPSIGEAFNVFNDAGEWCGVIIYGGGSAQNIASPYGKWQGQVWELERVALNGKQGHGNTSRAVAMTLKALKKCRPWLDLIVSYADIDQNHKGIIYQATNWVYTGIKNADTVSAFIIHGQKTHRRSCGSKGWVQSLPWLRENVDPNAEAFRTKGQHKYLYPMTDEMRKQIETLRQNYPK